MKVQRIVTCLQSRPHLRLLHWSRRWFLQQSIRIGSQRWSEKDFQVSSDHLATLISSFFLYNLLKVQFLSHDCDMFAVTPICVYYTGGGGGSSNRVYA